MRIEGSAIILAVIAAGLLAVPSVLCGQDMDVLRARYAKGEYAAILNQIGSGEGYDMPAELYMIQGDCLQKTDNPEAALSAYDRSALGGYTHPQLYLNRGICKITLGHYNQARHDLRVYQSKRPRDGAGSYWLATIDYYELNNKASIRHLDESIAIDSTYAPSYFLRGANYSEMGKLSFALDDFITAYRLDPSIQRAKLYAAMILLDLGRYSESIEFLNELKLESDELTAEVLYYLGEARFRLHDLEGACQDWSDAASAGDVDSAENFRRLCTTKSGKPRFKRRTFGAF